MKIAQVLAKENDRDHLSPAFRNYISGLRKINADEQKTGESDYCPRSFRKMPHRRATCTEPMDGILL